MSQDNEVNESQAITAKTSPNIDNPRKPISADDLASIVASHDKLQAWNNATDLVLQFDSKNNHSDPVLIQNIRNTAALIISSGRSIHSQNFELRRALDLSSSTLSTSATVGAFAEGVAHEATAPLRQIVDLQQPSSMNLSSASKRVDDLENAIMHFGSQALDLAQQVPSNISNTVKKTFEHPDVIVKNISNSLDKTLDAYTKKLDQLSAAVANGLKNSNPEQAIGFNSGVFAFCIIKEAFRAGGHKIRDFSEQMKFYPDEEDLQGNKMRRVFLIPRKVIQLMRMST